MKKTALLGILSVLVVEAAGCMMGPNYKRPTVSVPTGYRSAIPDQPAAAALLGNEKWWDVYQDPVLADLIRTALQQNYDVRIAAARVLEAQAQLGITRAIQFPSASVGADIFSQQNAKTSNQFPPYQVNAGQLNLSVIWNLDFWGKYRRQTEAARAQMLASEWGQRAVISSLVANVATAYFQLRALDSEIEISKRTLGSRQQSLQLTKVLETHGSASDPDVSQSEQLVYTASESIPDLERQIRQQENLLSILLGDNPGSISRGQALTEQPVPEAVLAYQQTVQNSLEQVSNALIAYQKDRDFRGQQELLTQAAQRSDQLSLVLYQHGGASYLQVLTNETNYFSAELNLVQAQLNERLALVQLYQALGGGWQQ